MESIIVLGIYVQIGTKQCKEDETCSLYQPNRYLDFLSCVNPFPRHPSLVSGNVDQHYTTDD